MSRLDYIQRNSRRNKKHHNKTLILILTAVLALLVIGGGIYLLRGFLKQKATKSAADVSTLQFDLEDGKEVSSLSTASDAEADQASASAETSGPVTPVIASSSFAEATDGAKNLLLQADLLAQGYDYDSAIALLSQDPAFSSEKAVTDAIATYEAIKASLVKADVTEITHVFFHSLIIDTNKAFNSKMKDGYNQMMTTKEEFLKMMQSMYDRGYVLVSLHDMAREEIAEDGTYRMVPGEIWLPEGKKPFVLSEDDVCYYEYMEQDGFASRIVIGEDGKPTCEMKLEDGTTVTGEYDVVPILNRFISEHPDFSYKGAKGILAFTGYNGILGYRTAPSYSENPTYEADKQAAAAVAQCLRDDGWELASHSWGHRDMGKIPYEDFKTDTDKWEAEVESLIGPTDIILFPFGSDIGDWKPYSDENERFRYLKSVGFRYFCNVDGSKINWVQLGDDHLRQGRRNLDGYRMFYHADKLEDLFDSSLVFDSSRPVPVPPMGKKAE